MNRRTKEKLRLKKRTQREVRQQQVCITFTCLLGIMGKFVCILSHGSSVFMCWSAGLGVGCDSY